MARRTRSSARGSKRTKRDGLAIRREVATDREFREEVAYALLEAVTNRTLAISVAGGELATGICIEFEGELFIATAGHAVHGASLDDIEFFARSPATMARGSKGDLGTRVTRGIGRRGFHLRLGTPVVAPDPDDLALLPIPPVEADRHGLYFHQLTGSRASPSVGQIVLVVGHPSELVKDAQSLRTGEHGKVTHPNGEWLPVVAGKDKQLKGFDSRVHYLLDFTRQDPHQEVENPSGMSGAGIWRIPLGRPRRGPWNPGSAALVGIQTGWYERSHLLQVTRIGRLVRLARRPRR